MARDFENSDSDRYSVGNPNTWFIDGPYGGQQMTFLGWAKVESFAVNDSRLMTKSTGTSELDHEWMISTHFTAAKYYWRARIGTRVTTKTIVGTTQIFVDIWYHVGFTYNYPTGTLWLDGNNEGTADWSGASPGWERLRQTSWPVVLGDAGGAEGTKEFDGLIAEACWWNEALSEEEIKLLANKQAMPGQMRPWAHECYYPLQGGGGEGNIETDYSGKGRHAYTPSGSPAYGPHPPGLPPTWGSTYRYNPFAVAAPPVGAKQVMVI
jgi:hypothetical protein